MKLDSDGQREFREGHGWLKDTYDTVAILSAALWCDHQGLHPPSGWTILGDGIEPATWVEWAIRRAQSKGYG